MLDKVVCIASVGKLDKVVCIAYVGNLDKEACIASLGKLDEVVCIAYVGKLDEVVCIAYVCELDEAVCIAYAGKPDKDVCIACFGKSDKAVCIAYVGKSDKAVCNAALTHKPRSYCDLKTSKIAFFFRKSLVFFPNFSRRRSRALQSCVQYVFPMSSIRPFYVHGVSTATALRPQGDPKAIIGDPAATVICSLGPYGDSTTTIAFLS
jgi:hypothetical protein